MRKITKAAVAAFMAGQEFSRDNTAVEVRPFKDETRISAILKLHGNVIARRHVGDNTRVWVCSAGWETRTTKERLNGLPGVSISQKAGVWYLNGEKWDGMWTEVRP